MKRGAGAPTGGELPRKLTAVGTLGDVGAAYTVYEKNWVCASCKSENYARRPRCQRCRAKKVAAPDALVTDSAGDAHAWREALDPETHKIYYYNVETNATQWERPAEMGAAPHATGWFGRGRAGETTANKYEELNATYLTRPARKQLEHMPSAGTHLEGAHEYNIWYDKYIGDHWANERGKDPAATRCVLALDAGATKADVVSKANRSFCLHFARGMCARGAECNYYHRIPTMADEARIGLMHDCFGRARHATDRDDMNGVGNFTRNSRTLYVGGLKPEAATKGAKTTLEATVLEHFSEWGEVESVNVVHRLAIAFVRFRHRTSAEFAKEAMANQALANDEVLNIRWAFDDPNPVAKQAAERSDHDAIVAMVEAQGMSTEPAAFSYPEAYAMPAAKRLRGVDGESVATYPDTDAQFGAVSEDGPTTRAGDDVYAQLSYAKAGVAAVSGDTGDQDEGSETL